MTRTVQIFIESITGSNNYKQIELFKEEKINTSLSTQNIADISKVYTDFTQSFTVPCSPINNAIFKHFYDSDLDATEDFGVRRNAYIEIDYTPFRSGRIQLESSELTKNRPDFYTLTFYGDVLSLKDTIKEDKLSLLNFDNLTNPYTGAEVKNRITDGATDYDVRYPLISSNRLWSYGDATSTDITSSTGRIAFNELAPAVKVSKIFEAIETKYDIDFQGVFLTDKRFTNLFLECKNSETITNNTYNQKIIFDTYSAGLYGNYIQAQPTERFQYFYDPEFKLASVHNLNLIVTYISNPSAIYTIDIYDNGSVINTIVSSGEAIHSVFTDLNDASLSRDIYFTVRTDVAATVQFELDYFIYGAFAPFGTNWGQRICYSAATGTITTSSNFDLSLAMPDITIIDFFSGVLKQFNLTCYALSVGVFQIEPLDSWYSKGAVRDITDFVSEDSITVERVKRYKNVSFSKVESESFLNKQYNELYKEEYGNLKASYPDGEGDYSVFLPFENLMFNKFTGTKLQVGYCLTKSPDFKPYVPKPILLYMYDSQPCSFKFFNGSVESTITNYQPFGQDLLSSGINYSLNFGSNTSSLNLVPVQNSIYANYYEQYLSAIFNKKNRIIKVDAIFPISLITKLRLNDRLVIRDRRYIINEINTDITTGDVKLVLIKDFRVMKPTFKGGGKLGKAGGTLVLPILIPNKMKTAAISTAAAGVSFSSALITQDTNITVTYGATIDPFDMIIGEDSSELIGEDLYSIRSENGEDTNIVIDIDYTAEDGATESETIELQQEG
jgi:hypothetical protein